MTKAWGSFQTFLKDESGSSPTEYAILIAVVIVVVITAASLLGTRVSSVFVDSQEGQEADGWRRLLVRDRDDALSFTQSK